MWSPKLGRRSPNIQILGAPSFEEIAAAEAKPRDANVGIAYRDLTAMERVFADSGLDWCCPRPTRLTRGPRTRRVKIVESFPMTAAISRADVAWWILEHAAQPIRERTLMITGG